MIICYGKPGKSLHAEIVFGDDEQACPLCEKEKEIDRLQREIEALREKIGEKE